MNPDRTFGFSALPPSVAEALACVYGHHRTPWFEGMLAEIGEMLRPALSDRYTPLFLTCTASGAREAAVSNVVRARDCVLTAGPEFERLASIWGAHVRPVSSPSQVGSIAPDAVFLEHVSATGTLVDVPAIAAAVRRVAPEAPIVLDASISFGSDFWEAHDWDVDAILIVPERALMGIPGVAILAVGETFVHTATRRRADLVEAPFLYDVLRYHRAWSKHTTPYSPNISACVALHAALKEIASAGGLGQHQQYQASRAFSVRARLASCGIRQLSAGSSITNAFTSCELPPGVDGTEALNALRRIGIGARIDPGSQALQLAHAGYLPRSVLVPLYAELDWLGSVHRVPVAVPDHAVSVNPGGGSPVEPPFTIAPRDFAAQARRHARTSPNPDARARIVDAAARVFRDRHMVHDEALRHRSVAFVGAGRIARHAVALCATRGVNNIRVYSPALARATRGGDLTTEERKRLDEWKDLPVDVLSTLEEAFTTAHAVVLLPVVYDDVALRLFRKPAVYRNRGLVSAELLARAERSGRLDLLINAAARGALVDRPSLTRAVQDGWLRYYSDEMPPPDDPLLFCEGALFTGHVGGSCRQPQAAVARNTHTILRHAIGQLLGHAATSTHHENPPNIVNAHLLGQRAHARVAGARAASAAGPITVLLTDPFDIESLGFHLLRELGAHLEIHDASGESLSGSRLVDRMRRLRPHILMLRSRTEIDRSTADALADIPEFAFVIRPGVGVDNLHAGLERLSDCGVQIINEPYGNSFAVAEMTLHFLLSGSGTTLLAPGPTKFHPAVFDVASTYAPADASSCLNDVEQSIGRTIGAWLGARDAALTLSGPGTSMMEASIANLTRPNARGLVISHGKFGDRFAEIAAARGRRCDVLRVPEPEWGRAITPEQLEQALQQDESRRRDSAEPSLSFLCFQQNETSSGVTYHHEAIRRIVQAARAYNPQMMIIVDAISGAFAHRLEFDALDLDFLLVGSQKALGVSSGLAFAVISARARDGMLVRAGWQGTLDELCEDSACERYLDDFGRLQRVHSINLLRALVAQRKQQWMDEPSIFHLLSTARALELFDAEGGVKAVVNRHARLAALVRSGVRELGLLTMPRPPFESDSVTVAVLPSSISASAPAIRKTIGRETGIELAGAQGDYWKERMIRIGTLGFVTHCDVIRCLRALKHALDESGHARGREPGAPANMHNSSATTTTPIV